MIKQSRLFNKILKQTYLVANSPRKAFYNMQLETDGVNFFINKKSGIGRTVLDKRLWPFKDKKKALKKFNQILKQKMNTKRKPRIYKKTKTPSLTFK